MDFPYRMEIFAQKFKSEAKDENHAAVKKNVEHLLERGNENVLTDFLNWVTATGNYHLIPHIIASEKQHTMSGDHAARALNLLSKYWNKYAASIRRILETDYASPMTMNGRHRVLNTLTALVQNKNNKQIFNEILASKHMQNARIEYVEKFGIEDPLSLAFGHRNYEAFKSLLQQNAFIDCLKTPTNSHILGRLWTEAHRYPRFNRNPEDGEIYPDKEKTEDKRLASDILEFAAKHGLLETLLAWATAKSTEHKQSKYSNNHDYCHDLAEAITHTLKMSNTLAGAPLSVLDQPDLSPVQQQAKELAPYNL